MSKAKSKVQRSPKGLVERLPIKRETADIVEWVTVATWTAASSDAAFLGDWCRQGRIKQFRLLIDYSFLTRRGGADAVDAVIQNFGPDAVRETELAIEAVQRARPDMTAADALAAVNLVRRP